MEPKFTNWPGLGPYNTPAKALYGPALYFSVLIFNLVITFFIGEPALGVCGVILVSNLIGIALLKIVRYPSSSKTPN